MQIVYLKRASDMPQQFVSPERIKLSAAKHYVCLYNCRSTAHHLNFIVKYGNYKGAICRVENKIYKMLWSIMYFFCIT